MSPQVQQQSAPVGAAENEVQQPSTTIAEYSPTVAALAELERLVAVSNPQGTQTELNAAAQAIIDAGMAVEVDVLLKNIEGLQTVIVQLEEVCKIYERTEAALRVACDHKQEVLAGVQVVLNERTAELAALKRDPAGRTPEQYAIEHGRYLATAAQGFMDACNALFTAEQQLDKAEPDTQTEVDDLISKVERAQEIRGERWRALERAIYEFTKRADRAYPLAQPADLAQSATYAVCKGEQL